MTSEVDGGEEGPQKQKADKTERGCVNFLCDKGRGSTNPKICGRHIWKPLRPTNRTRTRILLKFSALFAGAILAILR